MESLPRDSLATIAKTLTIKDLIQVALTNINLRNNVLSEEINNELANYFGFPYGLTLNELKTYEDMTYENRLIAAIHTKDMRIIDKILTLPNVEVKNAIKEAILLDNVDIMKKLISYDEDSRNYIDGCANLAIDSNAFNVLKFIVEKWPNSIRNRMCHLVDKINDDEKTEDDVLNLVDILLDVKMEPLQYEKLLDQYLMDVVYIYDKTDLKKKLISKLILLGPKDLYNVIVHVGFQRAYDDEEIEDFILSYQTK